MGDSSFVNEMQECEELYLSDGISAETSSVLSLFLVFTLLEDKVKLQTLYLSIINTSESEYHAVFVHYSVGKHNQVPISLLSTLEESF